MSSPLTREWLEADGLGGYASGTTGLVRTRRYHALLLTAKTPPTDRMVLLNGFDAWVETSSGLYAITSQHYSPSVTHPDGARRVTSFEQSPWPRWIFTLEDGTKLSQEILVQKGSSAVALSWKVLSAAGTVTLTVRPFLSGRDYHSLHHENPAFRFEPRPGMSDLVFQPYEGAPAVHMRTNGAYTHAPEWYRNFLYSEEQARGLDCLEDLASPGTLRFDLSRGEAVWLAAADGSEEAFGTGSPEATIERLRTSERRRRSGLGNRLEQAVDSYLVQRGSGETVVAGYPWFTDWGRDTFISLRGLCLATGRLAEAGQILLEWSGSVSEGMLPNRFLDGAGSPEYNSVDASLWYVVAVYEYLEAMKAASLPIPRPGLRKLRDAIEAIVAGYEAGARYGIRADHDGLLAAGAPGLQLTWMDAKVGDWVVTPRMGKPVEVQALWINALRIASAFSEKWRALHDRALSSFQRRFWNEEKGYLYDVVDVNHEAGSDDASLRPNQILAVGGLPFRILEDGRARRVVDAIEEKLLTPMGLRTLSPDDPRYRGRYEGNPLQRDGAYHQGTVWPYLMGAFAEAWVNVRGGGDEAKRRARERFLEPLVKHLDEAGLGHVSEIADADAPHTPRGCPFQAWSVGELVRLDRLVLKSKPKPRSSKLQASRASA
jgi:predicted glycogen debranching enzyme